MSDYQKVLVIGATGGTGRAAVEQLLREGYSVTAFSRSAEKLANEIDGVVAINGDASKLEDVEHAVRGQDAVIITLGITENPLRVRFFGTTHTPKNIRSQGTKHVIEAMQKHGVKRLVVQSSFGVGKSRGLLGFVDQLFFNLILKPQIDDTEKQEKIIRSSDLDWVIVQPVHLSDDVQANKPFISTENQTRAMKVARKSVAQFLSVATQVPDYVGESVTVSG